MIEFKNVEIGYKKISFEIKEGDFFMITGNFHLGKNDILHMIIGEIFMNGIFFDGKKIPKEKKQLQEYRKKFGLIFNDLKLIESKNIYENLAYPLYFRGKTDYEINEKINEILKILGIENKKYEKIHNLTHTEKQKIAIGRAIIADTKVLLFDGIHYGENKEIFDILKKLKKEGFTCIFLSHDDSLKILMNKIIEL